MCFVEEMKCVILAGGLGTRIDEAISVKPKPLVQIGGMPILWHIMKIYSAHNINDFVICCGYKGYKIKDYFANYVLQMSDITFDIKGNKMEVHNDVTEPWKVTLADTGIETMTGGRLKRVQKYIGTETFCLTYGDCLADVNIKDEISFHQKNKTLATIMAVKQPGRFGGLYIENKNVIEFHEKPFGAGQWINGGFFVLESGIFDHIEGDSTIWERGPLEKLSREGQLSAYKHDGFWHPMDTPRDRKQIQDLWNSGKAPWKIW